MTLPDLSELSEEELAQVAQEAAQRLHDLQHREESVRARLADPEEVRRQIANLLNQATEIQAIIDTPNSDIKANPQVHIIKLARAQKRANANVVRLLRVLAGALESGDLGE